MCRVGPTSSRRRGSCVEVKLRRFVRRGETYHPAINEGRGCNGGPHSDRIFGFASHLMYGCFAYIRWKTREGRYVSPIIAAKNKIGPKTQQTVPRCEICADVLGVRVRSDRYF